MTTGAAVRVLALSITLFAVIYFMWYVQTDGLGKLKELVDDEPRPHRAAKILVNSHLSWCDTRVKSIQYRHEIKIEQQNLEWVKILPEVQKIDALAVESWFGKHCTLLVDMKAYHSIEANELEPILRITFVSGDSGTFFTSKNQIYGWRGERFESDQLTRAIQEMVQIMDPKSSSLK